MNSSLPAFGRASDVGGTPWRPSWSAWISSTHISDVNRRGGHFQKFSLSKRGQCKTVQCRNWVLLTVRITRIFCTHPRLEKRQLKLFFRHRACRTLVSTVLYPFLIHFLLEIREINWNRYASRNCFWDGYQGTAYQLLAIFSLTLTTVPGIFAKVYSSFLFAS